MDQTALLAVRDKIGSVPIQHLSGIEKYPEYSDGDSESELLELFANGLDEKERAELLWSGTLSWPLRYHLDYERGNLLSWYNFDKDARVLEVGSGCGAITEELIKNENVTVVANELSHRRATINAYRNQHAENLEIVIGNLQDFQPEELFDYVVCVGVLEYAGTFIEGEDPYKTFLDLLHSFLSPGGKLLLAIENKLGLKYLSGAPEDHHGRAFEGINDYARNRKVQTFTKNKLESLLHASGFGECYFYYPHPDYKLPKVVFSDDYHPGPNVQMPGNLLPTPSPDQPRRYAFSEQLAIKSIEESEIFPHVANSFLVEVQS